MKKVLVLGGTGAMGVFLTQILSDAADLKAFVTSRAPHKDYKNISYIVGNARDKDFMTQLLSENHYDAIVDFMNYGYQEFMDCHKMLLDATDHYIFLSSSRVYDYSQTPLTEASPRLLETTTDEEFLKTQRYALRKARQEDMLKNSGRSNYTIIRPYITYSDARLQLGIYEKEQWLFRALHGKSIIMTDGVLQKKTSLTHGYDVAYGMFNIVQNHTPCGEAVHITTQETMTWLDVLKIYSSVFEEKLNQKIKVFTSDSIKSIEELFEGGYNTKYDRLFDRSFCNQKAQEICGKIDYTKMSDGLSECLSQFIEHWKMVGDSAFLQIVWEFEAYSDRICGDAPTSSVLFNDDARSQYFAALDNNEYKYPVISDLTQVVL